MTNHITNLVLGLEGSLANLPSSANQSARNSLVNSMFGFRLNKRNSHGISNNGNNKSSNTVIQQTPPTKCATASFNAQLSYDCAEDYMVLYRIIRHTLWNPCHTCHSIALHKRCMNIHTKIYCWSVCWP